MSMTEDGVTLQVRIDHSLEQAYGFLAQPENFPKWASGLGSDVTREGETWFASAPQGKVQVTFSERNPYGVLDHWVKLPEGIELYIPLRVVANGAGCTVLLTIFRRAGISDADFTGDQEWVMRDLTRLKRLLEASDGV